MNTELKKKILVIDDNTGILFVIRQALEFKNYEVLTLRTFESIEVIKQNIPDLIFLDVSLEGHDGREISRQLKKDVATKKIPIVILTGHSDAQNLTSEAQADDYLTKPFGLVHLWEKAAKYTANP